MPVLVFESRLRNISCDISIDNHVGEAKSKILLRIAEIDGRFRDMVLLVGSDRPIFPLAPSYGSTEANPLTTIVPR